MPIRPEEYLAGSAPFRILRERMKSTTPVDATGVPGSLLAVLIAALHREVEVPTVVLLPEHDDALRCRDDLQQLLGEESAYLLTGNAEQGMEALRSLASGAPAIVVATPRVLDRPLPPPARIRDNLLRLSTGAGTSFDETLSALRRLGFERKEYVEHPGDYAVRGGIVDLFPGIGEHPLRVEFSGDRIESIREFDPLSQRSIRPLAEGVVVPDLRGLTGEGLPVASLADYLPAGVRLVAVEPDQLVSVMGDVGAADRLEAFVRGRALLRVSALPVEGAVAFQGLAQPAFNGAVREVYRGARTAWCEVLLGSNWS